MSLANGNLPQLWIYPETTSAMGFARILDCRREFYRREFWRISLRQKLKSGSCLMTVFYKEANARFLLDFTVIAPPATSPRSTRPNCSRRLQLQALRRPIGLQPMSLG